MKCQTIFLKNYFGLKSAVYYEAIAMVLFSHVKISSFRVKAHLVFHWCLYNNMRFQYCLVGILIILKRKLTATSILEGPTAQWL